MKKFLSVLLAVCMLTAMAACGGGDNSSKAESSKADSSKTEASQAETSKEDSAADPYADTITMGALYEISKDRTPDRPSLVDDKLKEQFNVVLEWNDIQSSAFSDIINTMLASEEYPEVFWNLNHETEIKNMGLEGYLKPLEGYLDQMPNYTALWSEADLETMLKFCSASDGHLYYTPTQNYRSASMSWIYRKTAFDENGWELPKTPEELYELLKEIKAADPDSVPMPTRGKWGNAVKGMQIAYGVTNTKSYVDAWTGAFIPYGYTQDGFREALKWTNTFYKEGFIDPEFATGSDNQWTEFYANGKAYIEYQYVERALWAETNMKAADPDVKWEFTDYNVSADPSKGYLYQRDNTFFAYGYAFTDKISDEGLARMLDWCDYISTDEGATFMCMGVEGVTYQKNADGTLQFMDHMYHATRNPEGTQPWKYGMYMGILRQTEDYTREVGKDANLVVSAAFNSDPNAHYSPAFPTAYTPDQESRLATLDTQIGDMAEEYILKFIMSQLDPNDDNAWSQYLAALDNAGIQEASQIRIESYKKVSQ